MKSKYRGSVNSSVEAHIRSICPYTTVIGYGEWIQAYAPSVGQYGAMVLWDSGKTIGIKVHRLNEKKETEKILFCNLDNLKKVLRKV